MNHEVYKHKLLKLPPEMFQWVTEEAQVRGETASSVIREAIRRMKRAAEIKQKRAA